MNFLRSLFSPFHSIHETSLNCAFQKHTNSNKVHEPTWLPSNHLSGPLRKQGPVPEMSISVNPGLKFCSVLVFYIPMHYLGKHFVLLLLYLVIKTKQYIVTSSCMFLDEKTMLEIWLNPGLNLTIFRGTGPRSLLQRVQKVMVHL